MMSLLARVLVVVAVSSALPRGASAQQAGITWAEVPISDESNIATMEARGVWTAGGALYGYDGALRTKLKAARPWQRTTVVPVGSSLAVAGAEAHRPPKSAEYDGMFEWPSAALYDQAGNQTWLRRWTARVDEPSVTVLQIVPGADGGFSVAGRQSGCVTFGKPKGRFCVDEDLEMRQPQFCFEEGCDVPFLVRYDPSGQLIAARTFPGASGTPIVNSQGELAIYGVFTRSFDLKPPKGAPTVMAGLPDQPVSDGTTQGQLTFYGADGQWKWGRAVVGVRNVGIGSAAFSADGALWASVEAGRSASSPAVIIAGGRKPRTLFEETNSCEALLRVSGAGAMTVALRFCQEGPFDISRISRLSAARAGGLFWIPGEARPVLADTKTAPKNKITVVEGNASAKSKGPVVLWYRNGRIVWELEAPPLASIVSAYDPEDGRVCALFFMVGRHTWDVSGTRVTMGKPELSTLQVGCFPSSAAD